MSPTEAIENPIIVKKATRDGFGQAIARLGEQKPEIIALSANLGISTQLGEFIQKNPTQYIEIGVAEQNLAGVAAGLALSGKIPFMTSFAAFSPGRNWEQIRVSICYNKANVKIVSTHAGLSVGADGATHQALEDIALTRVLPNLTVVCPCDFNEAKKAIMAAAEHIGPVYIRLGREPIPIITDEKTPFEFGKANIVKEGKDITIIATGLMVNQALLACDELAKEGISAEIINCHTIKPLDKETILKSVGKTKKVITAEEHSIIGGLGGAVAELLSEELPTPMIRIGVKDKFGQSGNCDELLRQYECDSTAIVDAAEKLLPSSQNRI